MKTFKIVAQIVQSYSSPDRYGVREEDVKSVTFFRQTSSDFEALECVIEYLKENPYGCNVVKGIAIVEVADTVLL